MNRPTRATLVALLAASAASACAPGEPTDPVAVAANAKPGSGGGGTNPIGQLLGATGGSKASAVSSTYVVGRDGTSHATAWNAAGTGVSLPVDATATSSEALGVNSDGTIVGSAGTTAVVWQPTTPGAWAQAVPLPAPSGAWNSTRAFAVNQEGRIAGTGIRADNLAFALRWTPVGGSYAVEVVPTPGAEYEYVGHAIANGTGWVAGWVRRRVNGVVVKDAFVWTTSGTVRLLARVSGAPTEARGINASGRIVGWSATAPRGGDSSPVTWTCTETGCTGPTTLPTSFRNINYAFSIDDAGDIVGTNGLSGMLYTRCGTSVTLSPPVGWHQSYGWAISGDGKAAAGYSFPEGGATVQATRWALPAPSC